MGIGNGEEKNNSFQQYMIEILGSLFLTGTLRLVLLCVVVVTGDSMASKWNEVVFTAVVSTLNHRKQMI